MRTVVDASAVAAALVDDGPVGDWCLQALGIGELLAPHAMPAAVVEILRRAVDRGNLSDEVAALALNDLLDLKVTLLPFAPFAERAWELREHVGAHDAWCLAAAESMNARLVTLSKSLARVPGIRCTVLTGPSSSS